MTSKLLMRHFSKKLTKQFSTQTAEGRLPEVLQNIKIESNRPTLWETDNLTSLEFILPDA